MLFRTIAAMGGGLFATALVDLVDLGMESPALDRLGLAAIGALVILWVLQRLSRQLDKIERRLDELHDHHHHDERKA